MENKMQHDDTIQTVPELETKALTCKDKYNKFDISQAPMKYRQYNRASSINSISQLVLALFVVAIFLINLLVGRSEVYIRGFSLNDLQDVMWRVGSCVKYAQELQTVATPVGPQLVNVQCQHPTVNISYCSSDDQNRASQLLPCGYGRPPPLAAVGSFSAALLARPPWLTAIFSACGFLYFAEPLISALFIGLFSLGGNLKAGGQDGQLHDELKAVIKQRLHEHAAAGKV